MTASNPPPSPNVYSTSLMIVTRAVEQLREILRDHVQAAEPKAAESPAAESQATQSQAAGPQAAESDKPAEVEVHQHGHLPSFHRNRPAAIPDPVGERHSRIIPQDVKIAVSARDGGRCRKCGSSEKLHFDHVIPVSRGGANTVANIQLLCGACNRAKGAR
jgi:5-methylcytosine-specific restriction endonuclease McrA